MPQIVIYAVVEKGMEHKGEQNTLLNQINCYIITRGIHIDMASVSVCLTTMTSCSTCINIDQTQMKL